MKASTTDGLMFIEFDDRAGALPVLPQGLLGEWMQVMEGEVKQFTTGISPAVDDGAIACAPAFAATFSPQVRRHGESPVQAATACTELRPGSSPRTPGTGPAAELTPDELRELAWKIVRQVTNALELDQHDLTQPCVRLRLNGAALTDTEVRLQRAGPALRVVIACGSSGARDLLAGHLRSLHEQLEGVAPEVCIDLL